MVRRGGAPYGGYQLFATGPELLLLLMFVPGGLIEMAHRVRDRGLRAAAARHGLSVPSLAERPEFGEAPVAPAAVPETRSSEPAGELDAAGPVRRSPARRSAPVER